MIETLIVLTILVTVAIVIVVATDWEKRLWELTKDGALLVSNQIRLFIRKCVADYKLRQKTKREKRRPYSTKKINEMSPHEFKEMIDSMHKVGTYTTRFGTVIENAATRRARQQQEMLAKIKEMERFTGSSGPR